MKYITSAFTLLILCQSLFAEEKSEQLKLPDFPEGTAPSEKAKSILSKGSFEEGKLIEFRKNKSGKLALGLGKFHKLPDNEVSWKHLRHMGGFVIAFNQFIPLPEYKSGKNRTVTFLTDSKRQYNSFKFGREDKYEHCQITMKENTKNTRYLMKNFAYKFHSGIGSPTNGFSTMMYIGDKDNPIYTMTSYWKRGNVNSVEFFRDMTRRSHLDTDKTSRPLFDFFAPKGKTAEEAMEEAEVKMEKAKQEFLKRVNEK